MSSRVSFRVHPKFVYDGISRQAGSLAKAVLEGVMNSIEAGSSEVRIDFNQNNNGVPTLEITDNGTGIPTKDQIERYFGTFGTPHCVGENKIWAQFRMGRGQLFSFGKNTWLTGTHKLIVDINKWNIQAESDWNLDFEWIENQPEVTGCRIFIELYKNPVGNGYQSETQLQEAIKKQIEFISVPVYFNGTLLTTNPSKLNWDYEDENAYYLWARGSNLSVYNMGAFCKDIPASVAGITGVVVSKRQLTVNFARNDIQYDCPVWGKINEVIWQNRVKKTRNESRGHLNQNERIATLSDIRDGTQSYEDWKNISLIETSSGRALTLESLRKVRSFWCFAPEDDSVADRLMQSEQAICINVNLLHDIGYTGEEHKFFSWLLSMHDVNFSEMQKWYRPFKGDDSLSSGYSKSIIIIPVDKWNSAEKRIVRVIESIDKWSGILQNRKICIGSSDTYLAWTNGYNYIALDRKFLKRCVSSGEEGITELFCTIAHELAHDEDTARTHVHGEDFYRRYHDLTIGSAKSRGTRSKSPLIAINYFRAEVKRGLISEKYNKAVEKEKKTRERILNKLTSKKTIQTEKTAKTSKTAKVTSIVSEIFS